MIEIYNVCKLRRVARITLIKVHKVAVMRKKVEQFQISSMLHLRDTELRFEFDFAAIYVHISTIARDIHAFPRKCPRNIRAWMIYARACRYTGTLGMITSYLPHGAFLTFFQLCRNPTWSDEGGEQTAWKSGGGQNHARRRSINS